jgi:hypothetical protein
MVKIVVMMIVTEENNINLANRFGTQRWPGGLPKHNRTGFVFSTRWVEGGIG